ncbi:MAG: hypothetical protein A3G00_00375 [Candidatus Magasanikbacteria bacterium RIFCSPLOWO2_12_FULL_43_12]|uniref:Uncharacterized protein n=1 Tax=Candidatus Magasanikbacteria bacterium RIFCSPLOWO2_12_FULL_43_12 TaxID=1798692 RepID=A0A1F6MVQ9_9BACT|nr:MAG: hypothetical protein A3I93_00220 [Candidatus Magasanikbacteria bacterium RIFCSPLOWO2_02_FULL_43_22]OGH75580.1 MAG: hypothetical protein A3G00_00375 [Candidatus Magasanikbacteria bacterium RIFCSPLOWO2_12_FULL_43_12]
MFWRIAASSHGEEETCPGFRGNFWAIKKLRGECVMSSPLVRVKDRTVGQLAALAHKVERTGATMEEVLTGTKLLKVVGADDVSVPYFTRLVSEVSVVSALGSVMSEQDAGNLCEAGLKCAVDHFGYHSSPFWTSRAGYMLKHAPKLGPCYSGFQNVQDWDFDDKPTTDSVLFCPPRLVPDSVNKNVDGQMVLLAKLREKYGLPAHFFSSFGEPSILSGVIITNYNQTGERIPLGGLWARTNARLRGGGNRLYLGAFNRDGLHCADWSWDNADSGIGCLALGVVDLGKSANL